MRQVGDPSVGGLVEVGLGVVEPRGSAQHEGGNPVGVPQGEVEGGARTEGDAADGEPVEAEVVGEGDDVVGEGVEARDGRIGDVIAGRVPAGAERGHRYWRSVAEIAQRLGGVAAHAVLEDESRRFQLAPAGRPKVEGQSGCPDVQLVGHRSMTADSAVCRVATACGTSASSRPCVTSVPSKPAACSRSHDQRPGQHAGAGGDGGPSGGEFLGVAEQDVSAKVAMSVVMARSAAAGW